MWEKVSAFLSGQAGDLFRGIKELVNEWHLSPEQAAQLELKRTELEQAQALKLADLQQELSRMDAADRASARAREIAVRDSTPTILAYSVTAGFFGVLLMLAFVEVPAGTKEVLYVMVGSLGTAWTGIMSYYYGSSSGSASKQATIDKLAGAK